MSQQIAGAVVELVIELAETEISTKDLIGLRVGDIITTEKDIHAPLSVSVQGTPKFKARPGALKGRKRFRLSSEGSGPYPRSRPGRLLLSRGPVAEPCGSADFWCARPRRRVRFAQLRDFI